MCSKVKTNTTVKWPLVVLAMINSAGLAIYILIQILSSTSHLSAKRDEPLLAANRSPNTVGDADLNAKTSSAIISLDTAVSFPYETTLKFGNNQFEFELELTLHDIKFREIHPLVEGKSNVAHTCNYSLLDKGELLDINQFEGVTMQLLEEGCISYP